MLIFFLWALPILSRQNSDAMISYSHPVVLGVVCSAITLFFIITYGFGLDQPVAGASSAHCVVQWSKSRRLNTSSDGKTYSFPQNNWETSCGANLADGTSKRNHSCNLGYQKYYRPDLLVPFQEHPNRQFHCTSRNPPFRDDGGVAWKVQTLGSSNSVSPPIKTKTPHLNSCLQRTLNQLTSRFVASEFPCSEQLNSCLLTLNLSVGGWLITAYYHTAIIFQKRTRDS